MGSHATEDRMTAHAIRMTTTGGPEVLEYAAIDVPDPRPGEAVVEVYASGVNFIDTYHRSGLYEVPLPFTPGSEGAGVVTAVGSDVNEVAVGDRVAWVGVSGSYATRVVANAGMLMNVPDDIELGVAAAIPLQAMTAHYLISDTYPLGPGDTCLVHAAAGGTGRLIVQMAKLRGAQVIATAGSEEKLEIARDGGADHAINYRESDIVEAVEAAVGKDAIDAVYDGVGAATFDAGLAVLRPRGVMATFGNASGAVPPVSPLALMPKSLFLARPSLFSHMLTAEERVARWNEIISWVQAGELEIRVGHTWSLADAGAAHTALESRATTGKLLLTEGG